MDIVKKNWYRYRFKKYHIVPFSSLKVPLNANNAQ